MVFANYRNNGVGLIWSDTPTDPTSWNWHGNVYTIGSGGAISPHIIFENGLWYIFFSIGSNIVYITSPTINGTYSSPNVVLTPEPGGSWEFSRVTEPYVFKRGENDWVLIYMGDASSMVEQVGYATASNITGPYTKFSGNPCLAFDETPYDAGTIADPWVYEYDGTYYIGYAAGATANPPWETALAKTTDWINFEKIGIISRFLYAVGMMGLVSAEQSPELVMNMF